MAKVGPDGKVNIYNYYASTELLVDVVGYFTAEPDPLQRAGEAPFFSQDTFPLSDRLAAAVNLGTGNLMVTTADMAIPTVGGARVLGRTYNSLALASGSSPASPLFGPGWRFSEAPDRRLRVSADGSVTYFSGSGHAWVFAAGTLAAPAGADATLLKNADGTFKLTVHLSAEVLNFRADGLMTSDVDRNGNTITFTYPAGGGYQASIAGNAGSAPANTVTITYLGPGGKVSRISQTADATTRNVDYDYDASGYLFHVTDAGGITTFTYDAVTHDLTTITGPAPVSQVTQFAYDGAHRVSSVTRVIASGNAVTRYNFTNPARPTRIDADNHPATTYTVDLSGRVTATLDAKGNTTQTAFTSDAKVGTFTNASGAQTANTWDKNNGDSLSSSRQQAPTGAQVKATYNTAGAGLAYLPDTVTDSMGNASAIKYNGAGNLASNADALASMATIKSNADGTVDLSTDPMNVTNADPALQDRAKATQYAYNGTHQLTSITPPTVTPNSLGVRSFTYDGFGRLKTVLSARGVTTTYGYDALDRLRSETHSDPTIPTISYDYDANGNLFHRTDGSGITTLVSDAANRLTSKAIPGGPTLTYGYDPVGNLTSVGGDGRATPSIYQYDKLNLLEQLTEANGNRVVFAYNADGQRIDTWYAATYTDGLGVRYDTSGKVVPPNGFAAYIHSTLDTANKLTGIKTTRASSDTNVVADIGYSYDVVSPYPCPGTAPSAVRTLLRHSSTDNVTGAVTSYCYDGAARLTKAITTGGPTYTWAYDVDGNRTSGPEGTYPAVNSANQLTGPGTVTYDAQGNLVASPNVTSVYNGIDQASSITGGGATAAMTYAGSGQAERTAVGATVQRNGILGVQAETTAGVTTIYERDNQGTLISEHTPSGDFYFAFDGIGSVTALVDAAGVQRATYTYDPYGAQATATALNGTLPPNPWRYASGYLDPTGLYHFGARVLRAGHRPMDPAGQRRQSWEPRKGQPVYLCVCQPDQRD
jgi:YD repeat-containing protein